MHVNYGTDPEGDYMETDGVTFYDMWMLAVLFRVSGGLGPVGESLDGSIQVGCSQGGNLAVCIEGEMTVTPVPFTSLYGKWTVLILRRGPNFASLWLEREEIARFIPPAYSGPVIGWRSMPGATGDVGHVIVEPGWHDDVAAGTKVSYLREDDPPSQYMRHTEDAPPFMHFEVR